MATYSMTGTSQGEWFITAFKRKETDESTRPVAECFLLFHSVWNL